MLSNLYLGFKFALSYFSIIPVSFDKQTNLDTKEILGYFLFWLPSIGLILSGISIGIFVSLEKLGWLGAVISALSYMMLYGFIHTEAIIDVVDALYAKHSNKDAYKVIKEPTIGALGALWGFAFVFIKISAFVFLLLAHRYMEIITITIISRLVLLMLFYTQKFKSAFIEKLQQSFSTKHLIYAYVGFGLTSIYLIGIVSVPMLFIGVIFGWAVTKIITKRLGFCNGDVLGFVLELCEIFLMVYVSVYHL